MDIPSPFLFVCRYSLHCLSCICTFCILHYFSRRESSRSYIVNLYAWACDIALQGQL